MMLSPPQSPVAIPSKTIEVLDRLRDTGWENQIFSRVLSRLRDDVDDAFRLLRKHNVQRELAADPAKQRRVNSVLLSVNSAISNTGFYLESFQKRQERDRLVGLSVRWDWAARNRTLLATTQVELDTCHRSLLQVITAMQIWDLQLSEDAKRPPTPIDLLPMSPHKRWKARRRRSEGDARKSTQVLRAVTMTGTAEAGQDAKSSLQTSTMYYELEAGAATELSLIEGDKIAQAPSKTQVTGPGAEGGTATLEDHASKVCKDSIKNSGTGSQRNADGEERLQAPFAPSETETTSHPSASLYDGVAEQAIALNLNTAPVRQSLVDADSPLETCPSKSNSPLETCPSKSDSPLESCISVRCPSIDSPSPSPPHSPTVLAQSISPATPSDAVAPATKEVGDARSDTSFQDLIDSALDPFTGLPRLELVTPAGWRDPNWGDTHSVISAETRCTGYGNYRQVDGDDDDDNVTVTDVDGGGGGGGEGGVERRGTVGGGGTSRQGSARGSARGEEYVAARWVKMGAAMARRRAKLTLFLDGDGT